MGQFDLGGVVPWGRRLAEYQAFFDLGDLRMPFEFQRGATKMLRLTR
jgi:hypothetical protein